MDSKKRYILSKKETFFNKALDEGNKYLIVIDNCCEKLRTDSMEHRRILTLIDCYSRYKIQLREDFEELRELFVDVEGILAENEEFLEAEIQVMELMEEMEESEEDEEPEDIMDADEEFIEDFDGDDSFMFDEHVRHLKHIIERKHILANMESVIIRTLNAVGSLAKLQYSMHSKLKAALKKYCGRIGAILKRNEKFMKSLHGNEGIVKSVQDKYQELKLLLTRVKEKQMFFSSIFDRTLPIRAKSGM